MKIKIKKEMNLPQLIEYAWDNDIKNEIFIADKQLINIEFDDTGDVLIYGNGSIKTVKFSIEVEEEVNGETILGRLYEVYFDGLKHDTNMFTNTTTNSLITSKTALIYTVIDNQVIVLWEKYTGGFR